MSLSLATLPGVKRAAFFDLEKTVAPYAVEQVCALEMRRRGEFGWSVVARAAWIYARYDLGLISNFDTMKRSGAVAFRGRDFERDKQLCRAFFEAKLRDDIYPDARAVVAQFKALGFKLYFVSSTYRFLVDLYAEHLGFDGVYAVDLEVRGGRSTGAIVNRIYHQEAKAAAVREVAAQHGLALEHCYAFGDSVNDLAMLEAVGHPHTVNPARGLRKHAEANRWPVLSWAR